MSENRLQSTMLAYFLNHLDLLMWRDYLQEIFTIPERLHLEDPAQISDGIVKTETPMYVGKLVQRGDILLSIVQFTKSADATYAVKLEETGIQVPPDMPLLRTTDPLVLLPGVLANYARGDALSTTVGRVVLNYLILCQPFGDKIPYINALWTPALIENLVSDKIIREDVTVEEVNSYIRNLYFLGHTPELVVPNLSEKALTTDPNVDKRKRELLEEYKTELANGDAVAMSRIEQELIAMDKAWLKGDSSTDFYISKKSFDVHRKKMFLVHGMVEAFGKEGNFDFIDNSLEQGWTPKAFPKIANEIRAGSYSRAKETAKGGEESKFLLRIFQETRVTEDDCGTTRTLAVVLRNDNASEYIYRNHLVNGQIEMLSAETVKHYIGKTVHLRSPLFCTTEKGYCFTCMGKVFATLNQQSLATALNALGARQTTLALKKVHGTVIATIDITSLDDFVV